MGKGLKLLLAGAVLGLMAVFAVIGVKSVLDENKQARNTPAIAEPAQQTGVSPQVAENQTLGDQPATQETPDTQLTPAQDETQTANNQQTPASAPVPENNQATSQQQASQQTTQTQTEGSAPQTQQATETTDAEARLDMQLIDEYGGLQLTLTEAGPEGKLVRGQFIIRDAQDQVVANMKDVDTASFDLTPGIYEVTVIARAKKSARMVRITQGEFVTENFILPTQQANGETANQQNQANSNVIGNTQGQTSQQAQAQQAQQQQPDPGTGRLSVIVQTAGSEAPLKSNIYVQRPNGQNVDKKNYADFAAFSLQPGTYKVTVKAPGKLDIVRNVQIQADQSVQQVFAMQSPAQAAPEPAEPEPSEEGILRMVMKAAPGEQPPRQGRFVIRDANGKRVNRMRGVTNAELQLEPGRYTVIAVHQGSRLSRPVNIAKGRISNVVFNLQDFPRRETPPAQSNNQTAQTPPPDQQVQVPAQQGVLQLIAVDGITRQPLKVNFMVSTLNGRNLKTANNVSVTEVSLPPQEVLVDISYEEMRGQERIRVKAGEPTVFTFTITPNNQAPINQVQQQAPRSLEEMMLERLQQEILQLLP